MNLAICVQRNIESSVTQVAIVIEHHSVLPVLSILCMSTIWSEHYFWKSETTITFVLYA